MEDNSSLGIAIADDDDYYGDSSSSLLLNRCSNSFAPAVNSLFEFSFVAKEIALSSHRDNSSSSVFVPAKDVAVRHHSLSDGTKSNHDIEDDGDEIGTSKKQSWIVTASKNKNCCHILSFPVNGEDEKKKNNDEDTETQQHYSHVEQQPRHGIIWFEREVEAVALIRKRQRPRPRKQASANRYLEDDALILLVCTRDGTLWCSAPTDSNTKDISAPSLSPMKPSLVGLDQSLNAREDKYMVPCMPSQQRQQHQRTLPSSSHSSLFLGTKLISIFPTNNKNNKNGGRLCQETAYNKDEGPCCSHINNDLIAVLGGNGLGSPQVVYIHQDKEESEQVQSSIPIEIADIPGLEHVNSSCASIHCIARSDARSYHVYQVLYNYIQCHSKPSLSSTVNKMTTQNNKNSMADNDNSSIILLGFADGTIFSCHVTIASTKRTKLDELPTTTTNEILQVSSAILLGSVGSNQSVVSILSIPMSRNQNSEEQECTVIICVGSLGSIFAVVQNGKSEHNETLSNSNNAYSGNRSETILCQLEPGLPSGGPWVSVAPLAHDFSSDNRNTSQVAHDDADTMQSIFWNQSYTNNDQLQYRNCLVAVRGDGSTYALLVSSKILHQIMVNSSRKYHHRNLGGTDTLTVKLPVRKDMALVKTVQPSGVDVRSITRGVTFLSFHTYSGSSLLMEVDKGCWNDILLSLFDGKNGIYHENQEDSQAYSALCHFANEYEQRNASNEDRFAKASRIRVEKMLQCLKQGADRTKYNANVETILGSSQRKSHDSQPFDVEKALNETKEISNLIFTNRSSTGPNRSPCINVALEKAASTGLENLSQTSTLKSNGGAGSIDQITMTSKLPFQVGNDSTAQCCFHIDVKPKAKTEASSHNMNEKPVSSRVAEAGVQKNVFYGGTALSLNQSTSAVDTMQTDPIRVSFLSINSPSSISTFLSLSARYETTMDSNRKRIKHCHNTDPLAHSSIAWFEDTCKTEDHAGIVLPVEGQITECKKKT